MQVLSNLEQPSLIIKKKGRPANVLNKEEGRRVANFMDHLKQLATASQICLSEQTVGAAPVNNQGGKGRMEEELAHVLQVRTGGAQGTAMHASPKWCHRLSRGIN